MGCFNVFCTLCGGPLNENLYDVIDIWTDKGKIIINNNSKFLKILKKSNWLTNVSILLPNKKAIHGFEEQSCNTVFKNLNNLWKKINFITI